MALPPSKKGVSCPGVPGLRRAAVGMLQLTLPAASPASPPPALREALAGSCGLAPAVGPAALGGGARLRSGARRSVGLPKAAGAQTDHQRFLTAGYCLFSLTGTELLFIHAAEEGRVRSNLWSAAKASDLVHPGFCSADAFCKRPFTWGNEDSSPRLGGCFVP